MLSFGIIKNQGERLPLFRMMYPIEGLEDEHQLARTILIDMRSIIRYGKIPKGVGVYYEYVCQEPGILRKQMINLMDQENQLLFPKALGWNKPSHTIDFNYF